MPTYDYECMACGYRFEQRQSMTDPALTRCPQCQGEIRRLISGGSGYILKGTSPSFKMERKSSCPLESSGRTCCGQEERCGKPPCGDET